MVCSVPMSSTALRAPEQSAGETAIPVIDLGAYLAGAQGSLEATADALRDALEGIGFFIIVNHGVPRDLIAQTFAEAKRFHDQHADAKMALRMNEHNNGYMALGRYAVWTSEVNANTKPDLNEAFFVKRERAPRRPAARVGPAIRRAEPLAGSLPGFRENVLTYTAAVDGLGADSSPRAPSPSACAESFRRAVRREPVRLPPLALSARRGGHQSVRDRAAHRRQLPHVPGPDRVPGLQVRTPSGTWVDVPYVPDSFAVNSGDMHVPLEQWAVQIDAPSRPAAGRPAPLRDPFFLGPHIDTVIECLPTCQGPDTPPKYPPITYADY